MRDVVMVLYHAVKAVVTTTGSEADSRDLLYQLAGAGVLRRDTQVLYNVQYLFMLVLDCALRCALPDDVHGLPSATLLQFRDMESLQTLHNKTPRHPQSLPALLGQYSCHGLHHLHCHVSAPLVTGKGPTLVCGTVRSPTHSTWLWLAIFSHVQLQESTSLFHPCGGTVYDDIHTFLSCCGSVRSGLCR